MSSVVVVYLFWDSGSTEQGPQIDFARLRIWDVTVLNFVLIFIST